MRRDRAERSGPRRSRRRLWLGGGVTVAAVLLALSGIGRGQSDGAMFSDIAPPAMADPVSDALGACWADIDGDRDQDLFVATYLRRQGGTSRLWRNDGAQGFQEIGGRDGAAWPLLAVACAFVDVDSDGDPDLYVSNKSTKGTGAMDHTSRLYRNDGQGVFVDVTTAAGVGAPGMGVASTDWADFDADGDYDGFVATRTEEHLNFLFEQTAPFVFRDMAPALGLADPIGPESTFMGSWMDYDGDGDLDILLAKDWWGVELFRNDGGRFVRATTEAFPPASDTTPGAPPNNPMGVTWGDYNNDGCWDVFISGANIPGQGGFEGEAFTVDSPSRLYRSRCDGTFADVTREAGLKATGLVEWSANFVDFDNDGDLDLSVVAGNTAEPLPKTLGREQPSTRRWVSLVVVGLRRLIPMRVVAWLYRYEMMIPASGAVGPAAAMPLYLYQNQLAETGAATFVNVAARVGVGSVGATRGSAWADMDGDGDMDWFVPGRQTPSRLYRNNGPVGSYLRVHLVGERLRDAVGAWVRISVGKTTYMRHVHVLDGYLSQSQMDPHFGLGKATMVDEVWVRWPGTTSWVLACRNVSANRTVTAVQGQGCR